MLRKHELAIYSRVIAITYDAQVQAEQLEPFYTELQQLEETHFVPHCSHAVS